MHDGTTKKIYQINIGDIIIDAYGNPQEVYDTLQYDINEDIIELIFENEKTIRCTKDHKFLTKNRGWVEAQYLSDIDDIVEV
jgi:DNA polymerase-3 subunit alpha